MKGYQDGSRLLVMVRDQVLLAARVASECLSSFGSVLLVRRRYISPSLSLAGESSHLNDRSSIFHRPAWSLLRLHHRLSSSRFPLGFTRWLEFVV